MNCEIHYVCNCSYGDILYPEMEIVLNREIFLVEICPFESQKSGFVIKIILDIGQLRSPQHIELNFAVVSCTFLL